MAKTKISEYSTTAGSNTDISNINIDEGCPPANINNAIRSLMAALKGWQGGTVVGDVLTVAGGGTGATTSTGTAASANVLAESPTLTGVPLAPTATAITNNTQIATTQYVTTSLANVLASPTLTGVPLAPTATAITNNTQIATTQYVTTSLANGLAANNTFTGTNGFGASNPSTTNWTSYFYRKGAGSTTLGPAAVFDGGTTNNPISAEFVGGGGSGGATAYFAVFYYGAYTSTLQVGQITSTGSGNCLFTQTSDRRLKNNIQALTNSGTFIDALQPRTFTWINSGVTSTGFIADELQQVAVNSVTGEQNATKQDGTPLYQGIDCSTPEMIAHIIAELQSLRKRVAILEAR